MRPLRPSDADPEWVDQRLRDLELLVRELTTTQRQLTAVLGTQAPPTIESAPCPSCGTTREDTRA